MKIHKSSQGKKKLIVIVLAIVLLSLVGGGAYIYVSKISPSNETKGGSINYDEPTSDQIKAGVSTKEISVNLDDTKPKLSGSDPATSPVQQDNSKGRVSATITSANQSGTRLQIRFDIGTVTSSGTCTLTLVKGASTVKKTAGVQALAGNSTCKGFDIPATELSAGTWQVALIFENNDVVANAFGSVEVK